MSDTASDELALVPALDAAPPDALLAKASELGFVTSTEPLAVSGKAARMLPVDSSGLGVSFQLRTLTVAVDHIPTPAEFAAFERSSGCEVSVCVVPPAVLESMRAGVSSANTGRPSLWSVFSSVAGAGGDEAWVVPGQPVMVGDVNGWRGVDEEVMSASTVHAMLSDVRASGDVVCRTYKDDRWRVSTMGTSTAPALHLRRLPARVPRADELGVPSVVVAATLHTSGVIVVCGGVGSGRSTVAASLASRASLLGKRPLAVFSPVAERLPAAVGGPVWHVPSDQGLDEVLLTRGVVLMDDLECGPQNWARVARAGNLVVAVSWNTRVLDAVADPCLSDVLLCALGVTRVASAAGKPLLVFETLAVTPHIRSAVSGNALPAAAAAAGREVYRPLEVSLAAEVASGVLDKDVAMRAVVDTEPLAAALASLTQP